MLGQVRIGHGNPGATLLYQGKSPFNLYYRPLHPADFDALKAIHRDLFPIDYEEVFFRKAVTGEDRVFSWAAVHQDTFGREHIVGFVAARLVYMYECDPVDRRVMGLGGKLYDSAMGVYVLTLGVVAGCRKCGIAQQLLTFVQRHAESIRCRTVFLHVISYNDAAMRLYHKAGYTAMARLPNFYHLITGRQPNPDQCWYDAFLYAVLLPSAVPEPSPALQWAGGVLGAAVAPLRSVLGTFHGCMPTWLCRQTYNTFSPFATRPVSGAGSHTSTTVKTCPPELMSGPWPPPPPPPPPARYPHTYPQPPPPPSPFQRQQQHQQQQASSGPYGQSIVATSHSCSPGESGSQQHSQSQPLPPQSLSSSSSSVGSGGPQGENGYSCGWGPGSNGSGPSPPPPPPPPEPPVALHPPITPVLTGRSPRASSLQQRHPHGTGSGTGSGGGGGCGTGYPAPNSGPQNYHPNQLHQLQQQKLYIQHADKAQYQHQHQQHVQMQGQLAYVSSVGGSGSSGGQYSQPHGHSRHGEHSRGGIPRGQGPGGLPSHAQSYSSSHHHHHPHPRHSDRQPVGAFSSTASSSASSLLSSLFRPPAGAEAHPHSR